jgi:hypothetical protein
MENHIDAVYKEQPSHIRVVMGADLEYKCNKIITEETKDGFLLFKTSCSSAYNTDTGEIWHLIVLGFRKMYPNEKHNLKCL